MSVSTPLALIDGIKKISKLMEVFRNMESFIKKVAQIVTDNQNNVKDVIGILSLWKEGNNEANLIKECMSKLLKAIKLEEKYNTYESIFKEIECRLVHRNELYEFAMAIGSIFDSEINENLLDEVNECNAFRSAVLPYIKTYMQTLGIEDSMKCMDEIANILKDYVPQ